MGQAAGARHEARGYPNAPALKRVEPARGLPRPWTQPYSARDHDCRTPAPTTTACSSWAPAPPGSRPPSTRRAPTWRRRSSRARSRAASSPSPPTSRTIPASPRASSGPEMMEIFKKQAARFGTEFVYGDVTDVDLSQRPFRVTVGGEQHTADSAHHRHRRQRQAARPPERAEAHGLRRVGLRHLRRLLLQGQGGRRRRRRRHRHGGGDLPHQVRHQGAACSTAATSCARRRSCRTAPGRTRRSSSCGTSRRRSTSWAIPKDGGITARRRSRTPRRRRGARCRSRACSSPSATSRTRSSSRASSTMDERGYIITEPRSTAHQRARRVRLRRRAGPDLSPGGHGGGLGLHGRDRRRALARSAARLSAAHPLRSA